MSEDTRTALVARLREALTVLDEPYHREAIAATIVEAADQLAAPDFRQGCECRCCDHGEGSDCACDCHATGKCSAQLAAPVGETEKPSAPRTPWALLTVEDERGGFIERTGPSSYRIHTTEGHVCGLSGFGALGDRCPACDQRDDLSKRMRAKEATNG